MSTVVITTNFTGMACSLYDSMPFIVYCHVTAPLAYHIGYKVAVLADNYWQNQHAPPTSSLKQKAQAHRMGFGAMVLLTGLLTLSPKTNLFFNNLAALINRLILPIIKKMIHYTLQFVSLENLVDQVAFEFGYFCGKTIFLLGSTLNGLKIIKKFKAN